MKLRLTFLPTLMPLILLMVASNIGAAQDGVDTKGSSGRTPSTRKPGTGAVASKPNRKGTAGKRSETANLARAKPSAAENAAMGDKLFIKKDYAAAESYYRYALAFEPDNAVYNYSLGVALYWQQKHADAEPYLVKAVTLWPGNAALRKDLALNLYYEKKYQEAEQYYRAAVHLEPGNAYYNNLLGFILYVQQKHTEAEVFYQEAVRLEPNNAAYQQYLVATQSALKAAEKLNPNAAMHNRRGNALFDQAKYGQAEAEYREALRLDPQSADYTNNLGRASAKHQKAAEHERPKPQQ
ncbi:MAG: tetratricopeptide repeat protein [Pyrinomonadaceae bacterium]